MGLRGPKPNPETKNSRAHGNRKTGSTAFQQAQMRKLEAGEPVMPSWVTGQASKLWKEIVPVLFKEKLTHPADAHMLGSYCLEMSEYIETKKKISALKADAKPETRKALGDQAANALSKSKGLAEQFGMTSKSRVGMGILMTGGGIASGVGETAPGGNNDKKQRAINFVVHGGKQ